MKKLWLFTLLLLSACQSLKYDDLNPSIQPNQNLLPPLETIVDLHNLESTYSVGTYIGSVNNYGTAYSHNQNMVNWVQATKTTGTQYNDARVNDTINIFNKEVRENIMEQYGAKKGFVVLRLGYRGEEGSFIYPLASLLSFGGLNLIGFPKREVAETLEVEVQIVNNKKEVIGRYVENVNNKDYVAMWWGYNNLSADRKVAANNLKDALEKIRHRINQDASRLKKNLK